MSDDDQDRGGDSESPRELVLVGGRVADTGGYRVLRQRDDRVEVGELRGLQDGRPFTGEVVRLHPTEHHERLFECETLHETTPRTRTTNGPPQVASERYRRNWEQIFGALAQAIDAAEDADDTRVDVSKLN